MQQKIILSYSLSFIVLALLSSSVYAGCKGDCINGKGRYLYNDGQVYDGNWVNGKKHGQGLFIYKDKSSYDGEWKQGLRQGQGIYTWPNGQTYQGQFEADKMNGYGVLKYANGARYEGEIKAGVPSGFGDMLYASGQRYKGQWVNNQKHGKGEFFWPSGRKYVGEFFQDKLTGKGTYTHNNKSMQAQHKTIDPREAEKAAMLYGKTNKKKDDGDAPKKVVKVTTKQTPARNKPVLQPVVSKKVNKYPLKIVTEPADATIRILNIKPKYHPNIQLNAGAYEIEVSKKGYQTQTKWLTIKDKSLSFPIQLDMLVAPSLAQVNNQSTKQQDSGAVAAKKPPKSNKTSSEQAVDKPNQLAMSKGISENNSDSPKAENEKIQLAQLKEEIDRLKQQIQSKQNVAAVNTATTSTLPEIKQENLPRHALIIGNSTYDYSPLKNPANDAEDIAGTLTALGFKVILKTDVNQEQMEDAIADFGRELTQGGIGLFYYAGHGVQFEGQNYLIPINSRIKRQKDVRYKAVNLGQVLDEMGQARNGLNVAIIDACRNNPLPRSYRSGHRGLARVNSPQGTLIAYATSPGATAADGDGRNGLYTKHLLKYLQEPNITVEQVLKRVARDVREESAEKQTPWMESSFTGEFYFSKKIK